jgi:predicted nucleotidyltransferase
MPLTPQQKSEIIRELVGFLKDEPEIQRIVVFGSFLSSNAPNDLDVAVFQTSSEKYLPLAMKYRRKIEPLAQRIAVDVIPLRPNPPKVTFLEEIARGEVVYER